LPELIEHLDNSEISLLVGPRQSGKTTLMLQLIEKLKEEGKKHIYLNLDVERDSIFFVSQTKLLEKIRSELGSGYGYVFIDEIQKKENAGVFLKGIYDMGLPYKLIVTGSGSIELKEKIYESLAGRKRVFEIFPLSFSEFVNFKTDYQYSDRLEEYFNINNAAGLELLNEYLMFGGYPKVVLRETSEEKRAALEDIYKSFIEKDIQILLRIEKSEILTDLIKIVGSQNGRLTNYNELSNTLNISLPTIKKYLWYLEKTYIIEKSVPYFKNARKEITKSPIYYFNDLGLRNYLLDIRSFDGVVDKGFLFQNFVFNEIKKLITPTAKSLRFWRTKQGAEVDIVIDGYPSPIGVEAKYSLGDKVKINRSWRSFIKKFEPKQFFIVCLTYGRSKEIIPYYAIGKILQKY
jgi:hypothetical protein